MRSIVLRPVARRHRARRGAGLLAALLAVGACSSSGDNRDTTSATAGSTSEDAPRGFTPGPLVWEGCGGRLQCASLQVPLDYDEPSGSTITLAVAMLPATDPASRIGVLVTNPGGPGGSGVDFLGDDGPFNDAINRRFDVVSWDPRRVGGSEPLECGDELAEWFLDVDLAPVDIEGRANLERVARNDVTECDEANGALLQHIGTADAVHDVETIRLALGGDPITYVGFSYGTLIGLRYAERFPTSLRAMAIDGIVDPQQTLGDSLTDAATSIDRSLADVLTACDDACPIEGDPIDAYRQLVEVARNEPLHADDGQEVATNAVVLTGIAVTYDEGLRDLFYAAVAEGQRGVGNLIEQFAEGLVGEFDLASTVAVNCGDQPHPTSVDQVEDLASSTGRDAVVSSGLVSGYIRAFALPCINWPAQAPEALEPVTAAGSPPILVIGNTGDNVTSYDAARRVAGSLEHGRLLTHHGTGHTTYGKNVCADAYIDAYLLDLSLPPDGAECR